MTIAIGRTMIEIYHTHWGSSTSLSGDHIYEVFGGGIRNSTVAPQPIGENRYGEIMGLTEIALLLATAQVLLN